MVELKAIDAGARLQAGGFEAPVNGAPGAGFQFHIRKPLQGGRNTHVFSSSFRNRLFDLMAHRCQVQLL